ncbi:MAG TPA: hypothetical protein VNW46_00555 [Gemmatimonadaceae bacterium]|jgi:hypothetical protein|nr:hypothetical protein [Gemmatimonadaceae bacterium]
MPRDAGANDGSALIECREPTLAELNGVPYRSPCHAYPVPGQTERPAIVMVHRCGNRDFTIYGRRCVVGWEQWGDVPIAVLTDNCPTMDKWYEKNFGPQSVDRASQLSPLPMLMSAEQLETLHDHADALMDVTAAPWTGRNELPRLIDIAEKAGALIRFINGLLPVNVRLVELGKLSSELADRIGRDTNARCG